jgi:hypothetical protein
MPWQEEGAAWADAYAAASRHGAHGDRRARAAAAAAALGAIKTTAGDNHDPLSDDPVRYALSLGPTCFCARFLGHDARRRAFATPFDWVFSSPAMVAHAVGDGCAALRDVSQHEERGDGQGSQCAVGHARYSALLGKPGMDWREHVIFNHHDPRTAEGAAYFGRAAARLEWVLFDGGRGRGRCVVDEGGGCGSKYGMGVGVGEGSSGGNGDTATTVPLLAPAAASLSSPRKLLLMLSMVGVPSQPALEDGDLDEMFQSLCDAGVRNFELLVVRCVLRGGESAAAAAAAAATTAGGAAGGGAAAGGAGEGGGDGGGDVTLPSLRCVRNTRRDDEAVRAGSGGSAASRSGITEDEWEGGSAASRSGRRRELVVYELRCRGGAGHLNISLADEADTAALVQLVLRGDETRRLHVSGGMLPDPLAGAEIGGGGDARSGGGGGKGRLGRRALGKYGDAYLVTPRAVQRAKV